MPSRHASIGHPGGSLKALTRAADLSPDNAAMLTTIRFAYINLNRIADAVGPLQRAAKFAPKNYLVQAQLEFCLEETGQTEAASPAYKLAWSHLAEEYRALGRSEEAQKAAQRAAQLKPARGNDEIRNPKPETRTKPK